MTGLTLILHIGRFEAALQAKRKMKGYTIHRTVKNRAEKITEPKLFLRIKKFLYRKTVFFALILRKYDMEGAAEFLKCPIEYKYSAFHIQNGHGYNRCPKEP
jgi:hypothetical protein